MRLRVAWTVVAVALASIACGGGSVPQASSGPGDGLGESFTLPDLDGLLGGGLPGNGPSGATVRVVNTWLPDSGAPTAIDAYPAYAPDDEAQPLATIPYGEASAFFDPTADPDGNVVLSFYPSGSKDPDDLIIQKTETLQGGERITYHVFLGEGLGGELTGSLQAFFESPDSTLAPGGPTPDPANGLLLTSSSALGTSIEDSTDVLYISTGDGCLFRQGVDPTGGFEGPQPIGPGTGATYELEADPHTATIHRYPPSTDFAIDCSNESEFEVAITLGAGQRAFLFLYADQADELKAIFLPYGG